MTLRTPRRRISPQTKRRYRAIKGFFRRALGSSSHPHLQITSSIAVNVTDLKHKIVGLEQQLNEVSEHYRIITSLPNTSREQSQSQIISGVNEDISQKHISPDPGKQFKETETKILFKQKSNDGDCVLPANNETSKVVSHNKMNEIYAEHAKLKNKKSKRDIRANNLEIDPNLHNHITKSEYENFVSAYSTSSFHSLAQFRENFYSNPGYSGHGEETRYHAKVQDEHYRGNFSKENLKKPNFERCNHYNEELYDRYAKKRKSKRTSKELDQDFIADIIRRQYKPVSMFGRRESDFSQFSAPVCRDGEYCLTPNYHSKYNPQLRDCCCKGRHYSRPAHHSDYSDIRSVCDARLYSVNRKSRVRKQKRHGDVYNNSEIYDLVPVKEKSSPKSRRKFFEDNMASPVHYKEVPPSPRSQRPRLNLRAQYYTDDDDNLNCLRIPRKGVPLKRQPIREFEELEENYNPIEFRQMKKLKHIRNLKQYHDQADMHRTVPEMGTNSSLQYPVNGNEDNITTVEAPPNKAQDTVSSADKTDKALSEIKNILQHFLQEIKKEGSLHSAKSEVYSKVTDNCNPSNDVKIPNNGNTFNNYIPPQCPVAAPPYVPAFTNTCCYPIMPVCPMNCMTNSYAMPSTSVTCNNCGTKSHESVLNKKITKSDKANDTLKDTDELIKQIYKFVSQSPTFARKRNSSRAESVARRANATDAKLTSRSAGGSAVCRHDVKVGTAKLKCVSKSCEAIRSKIITDTSSGETNSSYSDTILDKLTGTASRSNSDVELSTELSELDQAKRSKLTKLLKSLGLRKKSKRDIIEELSESESTIDEELSKRKPPFQQHVTNYMMHGQEYHRPPPVSPHYRPEHSQNYMPPYNPDEPFHDPRMQRPMNEMYHPGPTAPPYSQSYESYNHMQPQVPLCLKEIEVKSIGCQSERKMSFFRKITQKMQQPVETTQGDNIQRNCSTQTAQNKPVPQNKLFNWMNSQTRDTDIRNNPVAFSYKTQKKLAEGDMKMKNAMLKKMFHKRNPFSPGNLIIRTLMGKDKSSFGDPPAMYRPRLFI